MKTLLAFLALLLWATSAQAVVITTQEWETMPVPPWSKNAPPVIDCAVTASPSGGCALKMTYPAGTYATSFSGGRVEYAFAGAPTDLYIGAWMRYSSPFVFHPVGHKVNFFILGAPGTAGCRNLSFGHANGAYTATPQICWGSGTQNFYQTGPWDETVHLNEWHWYEQRVQLNTPGVADGIAQMWIDDNLILNRVNVPIRAVGDNAGWGSMQHTAEYGGGGSTLATTQYWWIDHTVISTTRIGCPVPSACVSAPIDTQQPTTPTGLTVQ